MRAKAPLAMAVSAAMGLSLAACGSSSSSTAASGGSSSTTTATTAATTSSTTATSSSSSSSSADMAYFKGKTVTFIAPDKPGGSFDKWARLLAPEMGKYLGATVNVENVPPGNTIVGQNQLANSKPDGLTIGWLNVGEDVADAVKGSGGVTFKLSDMSIIGAPGFGQMVLVAQPNTIKSFKDLVNTKSTTTVLDVTKGTGDTVERVLLGAYGVKDKIITGYESSKSLAAGFLRNDGTLAEEELTVFQSAIQAGKAVPIWVSTPVPSQNPAYQQMQSVPTLAQLVQSDPPPTAQGKQAIKVLESITQVAQVVAAPPKTPTARLAALQQAFAYAIKQPSVKSQALKESLVPTYNSAQQTVQAIQTDTQDAQSLAPYLK